MPFEKLPSEPINYPIMHYPSVPARAPIPWSKYAEQIMRNFSELIKNLSPEERKRRGLELSILGSKAREANAVAELRSLTARHAKDHYNQIGDANDYLRSLYHGKSGSLGEGDRHPIEPMPPDVADTNVHDYYGETPTQFTLEPGPPKDEPGDDGDGGDTQLPDTEEDLPTDTE